MSSTSKRTRTGTLIAVTLCTTFTLLIWLKLRVVTGVPRSAYADPEQNGAAVTPPTPSTPQNPSVRNEPVHGGGESKDGGSQGQ